MKRSSNFLIALAAAIITFGALTLIVGPKRAVWGRHNHGWYGAHSNAHHDHSCTEENKKYQNEENKTPEPGGS